MKIIIEVDAESGQMTIAIDPPEVPAPILSWTLRKAEAAVFSGRTGKPPAFVKAAKADVLRHLNGGKG